MKYLLWSLLLSAYSPCLAQSAAQPAESPPQTLPELQARIEAVMAQERIPGLMLTIATKDSVLFAGGFGYANLQTREKVTDQTSFRLGSITKNLVALGLLHLVRAGRLRLDDQLQDLAPEVPIQNTWAATHPVRVVHLLEHTAGFDEVYLNKSFNLSGPDLRGLAAVRSFRQQLVCRWQPGERMAYSNADYIVLGYLLEKLAGQPWDVYLTRQVLQPLGMRHTDFARRPAAVGQRAQGYVMRDGRAVPVPWLAVFGNGADAVLNSTAADMARLLRFYLSDGQVDGAARLPASDLRDMETVHSTLAARRGLGFGYGLGNYGSRLPRQTTFHGHGGAVRGFNAALQYSRELGVGFALAHNGGYNGGRVERLVADYVTRHAPLPATPPALPLDQPAVAPYLGFYQLANPRQARFAFLEELLGGAQLARAGNALLLRRGRNCPDTLIQVSPGLFRRPGQREPSLALGTDAAGIGTLMTDEGAYYQPASLAGWRLHQVLLLLSGLALAGSALGGLGALGQAARGRLRGAALLVRVLPLLGLSGLAVGLTRLLRPADDFFGFGEVNATTLAIFGGTLLSGLSAALEVGLVARQWRAVTSGWTKSWLAFGALGGAYLGGWLLLHGFIGARVWTW